MTISAPTRAIIGLVAGLGLGIAIAAQSPEAGSSGMRLVATLEPIGTLWINAIRMTVIPLLIPLLVVGIAGSGDSRRVGGLGVRSVLVFVAMLAVVALAVGIAAPGIFRWLTLSPESTAQLRASAQVTLPPPADISFKTWLLTLIPQNPIRAASDGTLLPLVVFTLAFGFALASAGMETRRSVLGIARGVADAMLILVRWILIAAPLGVFALALALGSRLGISAVGAFAFFLAVTIALHLITMPFLYLVAAVFGRVSAKTFAKAVAPAQAVAFSSRSSLAALPALVDGARNVLRLPAEASNFVLPFAVSVFKLSSAINWVLGAIFVAHLYGIQLGATQIATIATASILLNASTPGIPSGGFLIQAPLYAAVGLPVEGIGILIAIDTIPDMFKTVLNVTADMSVAAISGRWHGAQTSEPVSAETLPRHVGIGPRT